MLEGLAQIMLGTVIEAQGRCEAALKHWEAVLAGQKMNVLHSEALLKKALCLENLAKVDEAREVYQRLQKDFAKSTAGQKAKSYLRLLDIKKGS